jgi:hypothetical protein
LNFDKLANEVTLVSFRDANSSQVARGSTLYEDHAAIGRATDSAAVPTHAFKFNFKLLADHGSPADEK